MATQLETLRLLAPEFASVDDTTVQAMLDIAPLVINADAYSEEVRGLALVYQACILLWQRQNSATGASSGGTLTREKEGDLERSFSSSKTPLDQFGARSIYHDMLARLSVTVTMGGITRMADWVPSL